MRELAAKLRTLQHERLDSIGSVLCSDIGKKYCADLGWHPFPINTHIELDPSPTLEGPKARHLLAEDLQWLCEEDEIMIRKDLANPSLNSKTRIMRVPDLNHILWHHKKGEFVCQRLFGKEPQTKGAMVGQEGNRIWVIWTHRFYGNPKSASSENTLYILRLVIENRAAAEMELDVDQQGRQVEQMREILQAAQDEASKWKLYRVMMWGLTPLVVKLVDRTGVQHRRLERDHEGIASLLWYGEGSGREDSLEWLGNEKYGWC